MTLATRTSPRQRPNGHRPVRNWRASSVTERHRRSPKHGREVTAIHGPNNRSYEDFWAHEWRSDDVADRLLLDVIHLRRRARRTALRGGGRRHLRLAVDLR